MNRFLWVWEWVSKLQALLFQKQVFSQVQVASLLPHDRWTDMAQATRLLATKETLQAASMCDSRLHDGKSSDSPGLHKFHDAHCCMLGRSVALGLALKANHFGFDGCRLPSVAEMDMKQCIKFNQISSQGASGLPCAWIGVLEAVHNCPCWLRSRRNRCRCMVGKEQCPKAGSTMQIRWADEERDTNIDMIVGGRIFWPGQRLQNIEKNLYLYIYISISRFNISIYPSIHPSIFLSFYLST